MTPNPALRISGFARRPWRCGRHAPPLATPAPYGPVRRGADGNPIRGGILTAWDPATQKERVVRAGRRQTDGGVLTTASNLVIQTTPKGHLRAYTADKGEKLLDITLPLTSGVGPPMTYHARWQAIHRRDGGTGAGRQDEVVVVATVEGIAEPRPQEPTAAAASECSAASGTGASGSRTACDSAGARSEQSKAFRLHARRSWQAQR